ncbi:hypothetical protein JCM11491_006507 [Sporobolomyces phaffii]
MAHRLSRGLLESQLEALDLCSSLFPQEGELTLSDEQTRFVSALRDWIDDKSRDGSVKGVERAGPAHWENEVAFQVNLSLKPRDQASPDSYPISLSVRLPTVADTRTSDLPPPAEYNLLSPPWLPRASYDSLSSSLPRYNSATFTSNTDFVLSIVDYVRDEGPGYIPPPSQEKDEPSQSGAGRKGRSRRQRTGSDDDEEFRVWLWFPSLSTREKRDDIVNWASEYDLTGFVLAGKPAVMCLEGTENNIQEYMADIKSNSWADIPSFQKKVSERYRTPLVRNSASLSSNDPQYRIFTNMSEITKLIPQSGQRGNRGDMTEVKEFLEKKGLGDAFGEVIGGGQFS